MQKLCKAAAYFGFSHICEEPVSWELEQSFIEHVSQHGLNFGTREEYNFRLGLFAKMDAEINKINSEEANFSVGHNYMSTWTDLEYKKLLGYRGVGQEAKEISEKTVTLPETNDSEIDWRAKGAVNPIKDQAQCGSCWAFSATAAVEGAHFLKTGELLSLSEQELVSCDNQTFSHGCTGGFQSDAFKYLETNGQELESAYPYTSGKGDSGSCKYDASKGKVKVDSYNYVKSNDVAQLKAAIAKTPVSVTLEADQTVFKMYKSGVLDSTDCGTVLDHAVAAVGYGTENGQDYYIVRNSWGTKWGDAGYIKIAAVEGAGICGIQQDSLYPTYNASAEEKDVGSVERCGGEFVGANEIQYDNSTLPEAQTCKENYEIRAIYTTATPPAGFRFLKVDELSSNSSLAHETSSKLHGWEIAHLVNGWTESPAYGRKVIEDCGQRESLAKVMVISDCYPVVV